MSETIAGRHVRHDNEELPSDLTLFYVSAWYSRSVSSISNAARFSRRCCADSVPGIGSIIGERLSSHASLIWLGVARWASAMSNSAGPPSPRSGK